METNAISLDYSEIDYRDEQKKREKRLQQLKVAPIINLDEIEFLGSSSLPIETENGLYHHKEDETG